MTTKSGIQVFLDGNLPVIVGECPNCRNGDRGLVLVDYVHNPVNEHRSTVYMKCIACLSVYQTNIDDVAEE